MSAAVETDCLAFNAAIAVLAEPWTGVILNVLQEGPLRFSEISERGHGVGDKVLSARLKALEARGLIVRDVDEGPPVRVSYALTPRAAGFHDVAVAIERWGRGLAVPGAAAAKTKTTTTKKKKTPATKTTKKKTAKKKTPAQAPASKSSR